jgi:hypothetical protein
MISLDSFFTKAQRDLSVRSQHQRTADAHWAASPPFPEAGRSPAFSSPNGRAIRPLLLVRLGGCPMDDALKAFVERQNISNYIERLKTETDAVQRRLLLRLVAEEEAKQVKSFI